MKTGIRIKDSYSNWRAGEPNGGGTENCLILSIVLGDKWKDVPCSMLFNFICQFTG